MIEASKHMMMLLVSPCSLLIGLWRRILDFLSPDTILHLLPSYFWTTVYSSILLLHPLCHPSLLLLLFFSMRR